MTRNPTKKPAPGKGRASNNNASKPTACGRVEQDAIAMLDNFAGLAMRELLRRGGKSDLSISALAYEVAYSMVWERRRHVRCLTGRRK